MTKQSVQSLKIRNTQEFLSTKSECPTRVNCDQECRLLSLLINLVIYFYSGHILK